MHSSSGGQARFEEAARAALEQRAEHKLTDAEWAGARGRLLEFAGILQSWVRTTASPRHGKVEKLCPREL